MRIKLMMIVLILAAAAGAQGKDTKSSSAEKAIRDLDTAWSQAAQSKDLEKMVSYYADDASALPFNAPIATGKDLIRQLWSALMAKPGFSLTFAPTRITVAKSNDLAYEAGTFELKMNEAAEGRLEGRVRHLQHRQVRLNTPVRRQQMHGARTQAGFSARRGLLNG
jgi:uncharacterized protein (TIGR02246 family)